MSENVKYELVSLACRSRFLYRTEAEYRGALGASLETIAGKRDSDRDMSAYYDILNRRAELMGGVALDALMAGYVEASDFYFALDWGGRSHLASKKRFCRMLFRLYATAGKPLSADEIFKFKMKDDDERLLREFFPNGAGEEPAADIGLIVLFVYGVVRPWNTETSRGRDITDKETMVALERLRSLIYCLRDDMPRLGSTEKPLVFAEWLTVMETYLQGREDLADATPLMLASSLSDISHACRDMRNGARNRLAGENLQGLFLSGIWVDDADGGRSRFWIFPDNSMLALCYQRNGASWEMLPYEFRVRFSDHPDYWDVLIMVAPEGNLNFTLSREKVIGEEHIAECPLDPEFDEESEDVMRIVMHDESRKMPAWFDWRAWERLRPDSPLYEELHATLMSLYDRSNPHSALFRNAAPELTDGVNNLVGHDRKYLYVYDSRPDRFAVLEREPEKFTYEAVSRDQAAGKALFELEISEERPLYAVPKRRMQPTQGCLHLERFAAMLDDADNVTEAYIVHSPRIRCPQLTFPSYGVAVSLDPAGLSETGIIKFTSATYRLM